MCNWRVASDQLLESGWSRLKPRGCPHCLYMFVYIYISLYVCMHVSMYLSIYIGGGAGGQGGSRGAARWYFSRAGAVAGDVKVNWRVTSDKWRVTSDSWLTGDAVSYGYILCIECTNAYIYMIYTCLYIEMYTQTHIETHINTHTHTHKYTHTNTHTHRHTTQHIEHGFWPNWVDNIW